MIHPRGCWAAFIRLQACTHTVTGAALAGARVAPARVDAAAALACALPRRHRLRRSRRRLGGDTVARSGALLSTVHVACTWHAHGTRMPCTCHARATVHSSRHRTAAGTEPSLARRRVTCVAHSQPWPLAENTEMGCLAASVSAAFGSNLRSRSAPRWRRCASRTCQSYYWRPATRSTSRW